MGSQPPPLSLPFFQLTEEMMRNTDIKGTGEWSRLCGEIRAALEEHGLLIVSYDGISGELLEKAFNALRELFDLPVSAKRRNATKEHSYNYIGGGPMFPLYETLAYLDIDSPENIRAFVDRMWNDGNDDFLETIGSLSSKMLELGRLIMNIVHESYGLMRKNDGARNWPEKGDFRMTKYSAPMSKDPALGLLPHTDRSYVTLLRQVNGVDGLRVRTREGEWVDAKLSSAPPSSMIVFAGTILQAWSNRRIIAPLHKVELTGDEARSTCGLFLMPGREETIIAPAELVDEDHPAHYRPFRLSELINISRENETDQNIIEEFAAV